MMGSLFSSISGLRNHTTWMNTIGNNISNVNTVGYKMQRVTFKEQITQMMGAASGANVAANIGGKNPQQMGLGSVLGSIDTIMTQGAIQTTGNPLDIAIQGEGFFAVKAGATTYYTRAGNFYQDNQGNIVTSDGYILQGWMGGLERTLWQVATDNPPLQIREATYNLDTSDVSKIGNVTIPKDLTMAAQATRYVKFVGNLDSMTPMNSFCAPVAIAAGTQTPLPSNYSPNEAPVAGGNAAPTLTEVQAGALPGTGIGGAGTNYYFHTDPNDPNSPLVTPDHTATMTIYDSLGNERSLTIWFFQHGTDPTGSGASYRPVWDWYAFDTTYVPGSNIYTGEPDYFNCIGGTNIDMVDPGNANPSDAEVYSPIWFNQDGSLASNGGPWDLGGNATGLVQDYSVTIEGVTHYGPQLYFTENNAAQGIDPDGAISPWNVLLDFGTPNAWDTSAQADTVLHVNDPAGNTPVDPAGIGLRDGLTGDVTGEYQIIGGVQTYVPNSTAYAKEQDGYGAGELIGLSVDSTGGIVGQFTNERSLTIAKIAIAQFANAQGLEKVGNSMYAMTSNSGIARMTEAGTAGAGTTVGGALEASNVDLSVELTNMIIAQRGFEANARIITTSADMLDTLVNVGR
ncbi:hypothetical protein DRQ09_08475 [candidate division KSB1 bacterium]|nr:MAG: hypothetical protein DRQ09_08475 [candidate division KSB1 bacterium]